MTPYWIARGTDDCFDAVEAFISTKIWGAPRRMGGDTALVVLGEKQIQGAVIYHNYDPEFGVIEISGVMLTPRACTRAVIWEMYDYPFNQLGCQTVVQITDGDDEHQAKLLPRYGFVPHRLPRLRGRNKDAIVYLLHDDVWRKNGVHKQNKEFVNG